MILLYGFQMLLQSSLTPKQSLEPPIPNHQAQDTCLDLYFLV